MPLQFLGFTPAEAAMLRARQTQATAEAATASLDAYGGTLAPADILKLLVYHIRAVIDLGLPDHATKLLAGLMQLLAEHPELTKRPDGTGPGMRALRARPDDSASATVADWRARRTMSDGRATLA